MSNLGYLQIDCDKCHVFIEERRVTRELARIYFSNRQNGRRDYCKVCA
jgi:hypothetical protein